MFAPHCSTCGHRVLLGPRRVIGAHPASGPGFLLRCHCGTAVWSNAEPPATEVGQRGAEPRPQEVS